MFVMVYLVNNINTEWRITFQHFNLAMVAILVDLIMQYWIGTSKDEENDKKPFILILAIELLLAIIGLLVGYQIGICIIIVGYICGFLCNKKRKLGGETKNTASSIDEGMKLFLLLFAFNDII